VHLRQLDRLKVEGMDPKVAIIGCGLIGKKRAAFLPKGSLKYACDLDLGRAESLAEKFENCTVTTDAEEAASAPDVNIVIVATLNASLAPIAEMAARNGKHVLVEKPGAIHSAELESLKKVSDRSGSLVRIGYNHRFHPALRKAYELFSKGAIGEMMFIRGRYGHGGRVGYEKEWRSDSKLSGGGELIDQGVHLIDLAGWFMGEFDRTEGHACTSFWQMPVDDNAFISLRTKKGQTAWLQVSCTEWKNLFSLEIYGKTGKLHIEGLGGSYGIEKLAYYRMLPEMGPPETTIYEYPRGDDSWKLEMDEFLEDIRLGRAAKPGLTEGIATLKAVEEIYRRSRTQ
jgi:predicted dehydrogenase